MRVLTSLLMLLFLVTAHDAIAQTAGTTSRLEQLRTAGADALFNLDYESARQTFKEMAHEFPDEPLGPRMVAWTIWLETLNQNRLQQGAIYSSQSFGSTLEDKPEPKTVAEFRDFSRRAEQLARTHLQRNPRDPETLYELGEVETLKASFAATVEGRYLAALRDASSGVDHEREVLKLDHDFHDAELTIGLYDYVLGNLPLSARLVASFMGERGSKKRGVATLERVAKDGNWERDYGKLLLIALYKDLNRVAESLMLSRELQQKYPRNYLFKLETADSLSSQAAEERRANRSAAADALQKEAVSIFTAMFSEHGTGRIPEQALGLVHFRYAELLSTLGQSENAAREFLATTIAHEVAGELATRAHLRAGQSFDLAGKRDEALAEYRIVLTRPPTRDLQEQARRSIKEPYKLLK